MITGAAMRGCAPVIMRSSSSGRQRLTAPLSIELSSPRTHLAPSMQHVGPVWRGPPQRPKYCAHEPPDPSISCGSAQRGGRWCGGCTVMRSSLEHADVNTGTAAASRGVRDVRAILTAQRFLRRDGAPRARGVVGCAQETRSARHPAVRKGHVHRRQRTNRRGDTQAAPCASSVSSCCRMERVAATC